MIEQQLGQAFPANVRNELCAHLRAAYNQAFETSREFSSFALRARGYLQHFYSEAYLKQAASKLQIDHAVQYNRARNTPHLVINSQNWQMTPHRLPIGRNLPVSALYRGHYSLTNDLFADSDNLELAKTHSYGYVYLLHSGSNTLESATLTVPDSQGLRAIHNEYLDTLAPMETGTEEIDDTLDEKIKILVEQKIVKTG